MNPDFVINKPLEQEISIILTIKSEDRIDSILLYKSKNISLFDHDEKLLEIPKEIEEDIT